MEGGFCDPHRVKLETIGTAEFPEPARKKDRKARGLPPAKLLRELFKYDKKSGVLIGRVQRGPLKPGSVAGVRRADGYIRVTVDGGHYYAHRIAWKMVTGRDPRHLIDHRNRDASDNSWRNLREATKSENLLNCGCRRDNSLGVKGVSKASTGLGRGRRGSRWSGKYRAYVSIGGKTTHIGVFPTIEAAREARWKTCSVMHGEFARKG